jgi:hypothetical protein
VNENMSRTTHKFTNLYLSFVGLCLAGIGLAVANLLWVFPVLESKSRGGQVGVAISVGVAILVVGVVCAVAMFLQITKLARSKSNRLSDGQ